MEAGARLDEMKYIGKMNEIPDNHFVSYSVKIFGLSCNRINSLKVSNSLNRNPDIVFVKITVKCSDTSFATDILELRQVGNKALGSSVNFLSIHGYQRPESFHPEIESLVEFVRILSCAENTGTIK